MILKTLTLRNFRRFKNSTIEFPDGVIGVIGLNGAGKSTIFEAIAWALYGSNASRTSVENIKRNGADQKEPCNVELMFEFDENKFHILREIKGKTHVSSATVTMNNKIVATGSETSTKLIQKTLGMDYKSFFTSIFAKQKELNTLSSMNPSERRPLILKMLGIDSLDFVIKNINSDKRLKTAIIEKIKLMLIDENGEEKIKTYQKQLKQKEELKKQLKQEISKEKQVIKEKQKEIKIQKLTIQQNKKSFEEINKELEKQSNQKTMYEHKLKLKDEILKITEKIKQRENKIQQLKQKIKKYKEITKEQQSLEQRLKKITLKHNEIIKAIEQKNTHIKTINNKIKQINQKKEKITNLGPSAKCPTCEKTLGNQYNNLISQYKQQIKEQNEEQKIYAKELSINKHEIEIIIREQTALKKKREYLYNKQSEKEKLKTTLETIKQELESEIKKRKSSKLKKLIFYQKNMKN
jgi:exonuclease SbcC